MNMNDDAMSLAMFWTGLLFVLTPIVSAGLVIGLWRYTQKREAEAASRNAPPKES
ncbi:MAG: hypothetical protein ABIP66_07930 [Gemmatimonadaceae bacterium]